MRIRNIKTSYSIKLTYVWIKSFNANTIMKRPYILPFPRPRRALDMRCQCLKLDFQGDSHHTKSPWLTISRARLTWLWRLLKAQPGHDIVWYAFRKASAGKLSAKANQGLWHKRISWSWCRAPRPFAVKHSIFTSSLSWKGTFPHYHKSVPLSISDAGLLRHLAGVATLGALRYSISFRHCYYCHLSAGT